MEMEERERREPWNNSKKASVWSEKWGTWELDDYLNFHDENLNGEGERERRANDWSVEKWNFLLNKSDIWARTHDIHLNLDHISMHNLWDDVNRTFHFALRVSLSVCSSWNIFIHWTELDCENEVNEPNLLIIWDIYSTFVLRGHHLLSSNATVFSTIFSRCHVQTNTLCTLIKIDKHA